MDEGKTNTLKITTPEGVSFSLLLAGPMTRFLAWLVDSVLVMVVVTLLQMALMAWVVVGAQWVSAIGLLAVFGLWMGYGIVTEWMWRGQTVGKRFLRLRVVDVNGLRLQFSQIVIRNLLRVVDGLPLFYMVGGLVALISRRGQRLGDLAANTVVVRTPKIMEPDLSQIMAGKFNSFRDYPHLEARLRQRVLPEEAAIALQTLIRRDRFDPAERVELFRALAGHFQKIITFPLEATEGLTDEQYTRNVVDSLFRKAVGKNGLPVNDRSVEGVS